MAKDKKPAAVKSVEHAPARVPEQIDEVKQSEREHEEKLEDVQPDPIANGTAPISIGSAPDFDEQEFAARQGKHSHKKFDKFKKGQS